MSLFSSLFGGRPLLGVDIGTTSLKVAELASGRGGLSLANYGILETYGYLERANSAFQTSTLKLSEADVAAHLRLLLERIRPATRDAAASVPAFSAFSTLIELPTASLREINRVMQFQAKQYVPIAISEVELDWQKVGERTDENGVKKDQILLMAIVREQVERYRKIFRAAGLTLRRVEIDGVSSARSLTRGIGEPTLVVDIGSRSTGLFIAQDGHLKFSGQTDFSGGSLTQTIATGLNIGMLRAEDLKRERGLSATAGERELSTLMEVILDVIVREANRVRRRFEDTYGTKVKRLILTGGGANLMDITSYVEKQMDVPVERANPFGDISYPESVKPLSNDLGPLLSVAIGLGLRGFVK